MASGNVLIYFSRFGKPLQTHHKIVLNLAAETIAKIKGYDFGGHYDTARDYPGPLYFVPDDTVLLNEAACLGIRSPNDLYGGVVPYLFAKTKAITHGLVDLHAERPLGWCSAFTDRVREIVLPGYTVFSDRDARVAAGRMLTRGPVRLKKPASASGRDQTVVASWNELDAVLEKVTEDEMATYGLVLEENLRQVRTLSIGEIAIGSVRISYHGTQRTVRDNQGRPVYGGSDLVCVRGGWEAFDALPMVPEVHAAVVAARRYDEATAEFHGFVASRRNYDVGQGIGVDDRPRSGVLEPSWRAGGASSAELAALAAFASDQSLQIVRASHVEEYGKGCRAPAGAMVDFQGDDPEAGPMLRYTIVTPQNRLHQKTWPIRRGLAGLSPSVISSQRQDSPVRQRDVVQIQRLIDRGDIAMISEHLNEADGRVVRLRPRTAASHRSHLGKALIAHSGPDYSPVPDLLKYERPESIDDYRHRMVVNAIALVFVTLLIFAGLWLVNMMAHS